MWDITVETSLNVDFASVEKIAADVGYWFIDIKDMDLEIYEKYTGQPNANVLSNLSRLHSLVPDERICIRVPRIPEYNDTHYIRQSVKQLKAMGFSQIEEFDYIC